MLGEFITRGLLLVLGYAYPAFECFKTIEKNRIEIQELRFWCQYWIIVALLTVLERIGDTFISWVPMYGEMKLALIIYLWYPKTKGTGYVYETLLRPYVANHETDIERNLLELRARAWDLALYYWKNFANLGQSTFFQIIQFLAFQTGKISKANDETADQHLERLANKHKNENHNPTPSAPPLPPAESSSFSFFGNRRKPPSDHRRRPPMPPQSPGYMFRSMAQAPKSNVVQVNLHSQTGYVHTHNYEDLDPSDPRSGLSGSPDESETGVNHRINAARFKLRRSKAFN